jgi:hypothetical protein
VYHVTTAKFILKIVSYTKCLSVMLILIGNLPHCQTAGMFLFQNHHHYHHHHKHQGLVHLTRSVSRVTVALSIFSSVSQLFSFLVGCSEIILKGFGFVAFISKCIRILLKFKNKRFLPSGFRVSISLFCDLTRIILVVNVKWLAVPYSPLNCNVIGSCVNGTVALQQTMVLPRTVFCR